MRVCRLGERSPHFGPKGCRVDVNANCAVSFAVAAYLDAHAKLLAWVLFGLQLELACPNVTPGQLCIAVAVPAGKLRLITDRSCIVWETAGGKAFRTALTVVS